MKKILVVDDDTIFSKALATMLGANGYEAREAHSAAEARKLILAEKPDAIILDIIMETDTAGLELVNQIRNERPDSKYTSVKNTPVIILTGIDRVTHSRFSLDEGSNFLPEISAFFTKPVATDVLLAKLAACVK
ncbi:MAG: response regulator [Spirochaetes bacterium]|nr:response regulator [Spirochaetota bacterium]